MDVFVGEVYTVITDSLLLALAATAVVAIGMSLLLRIWLALGGLKRRSLSWTRGARGFHAVFWILVPSLVAASLGLLRGVETHTLASVERHQPAIEQRIREQWQTHGHVLERPGQELAQQRQDLDRAVAEMPGWSGYLLQKALQQLNAWVDSTIGDLNVNAPGWSERPVTSLARQWQLGFFALYFSLLTGLAPLLLLPLAEWLASVFVGKRASSEEPL